MSISIDTPAINSAPSTSTITTAIGVQPVRNLNNWNNTAFSQLCLNKSDDALSMLMHSAELSLDKRKIAQTKLAERRGDQI